MEPKIWITTYGLYNAGALIGDWFDGADYDEDDIFERIRALVAEQAPQLADCIGEELMFCDVEDWCGVEYERFPRGELAELAALIEDEPDRVAILIEWRGAHYFGDVDHLRREVSDLSYYEGRDDSDAAYGFCEDSGVLDEIPAHLREYFDCDAYVDSMVNGGEASYIRHDGTTYLVLGY